MTALVWFRDDLRISDHAALSAAVRAEAVRSGDPVIAVYVLDEERPLGSASKWWLHHSLESLRADLAHLGIPLVLRRGSGPEVIREIVQEQRITDVFWNRRYGSARHLDADLKTDLRTAGVNVISFPGSLLAEPWEVTTQQGTPFRVYTPFANALRQRPMPAAPLPVPAPISVLPQPALQVSPDGLNSSDELDSWGLLPDWSHEFDRHWTPGETGALERLRAFFDDQLAGYETGRDTPSLQVTSRLSPHLRFGEVSPRTVWHEAMRTSHETGKPVAKFLSEIMWREFAWHTLFHNPDMGTRNLDRRFDAMPWIGSDAADTTSASEYADSFRAWRTGTTGFPLVDAGMRELWATGTMHNRVRMVTASFLTKNLLIDWRDGEAWFWDTLLDADEASNPFNWQWVAGSGVDAAPYFRVFNPLLQEKKFDPDGIYTGTWAPESLMHTPIVDLAASRQRALAAYDVIKANRQPNPQKS